MALVLDVTLISGKRASLQADLAATLESLNEGARRALRVRMGGIFNATGSVLDGDSKLQTAG